MSSLPTYLLAIEKNINFFVYHIITRFYMTLSGLTAGKIKQSTLEDNGLTKYKYVYRFDTSAEKFQDKMEFDWQIENTGTDPIKCTFINLNAFTFKESIPSLYFDAKCAKKTYFVVCQIYLFVICRKLHSEIHRT